MSDFHHVFERGTTARTIVALHGTGGDERDLVPLAKRLFPGAGVLAPRGRRPENGANRFFRRFAEGVFDVADLQAETHALADFVRDSARQYEFEASNVWALGYSNGANIAASTLLLRPEVFAGSVLLRAMTPFEPETVPDLEGKAVFLAAGDADPIVPVADVRRVSEILQIAGADVTLRFERGGHGLTEIELRAFQGWITGYADRRTPEEG